ASINHPHVVKVYATGRKNGFFYIAMEIVGGGTLADKIRRQGLLPEAAALTYGIQLAEGLKAAWERGLLHRDVKPGNALFAEAETIKWRISGWRCPWSRRRAKPGTSGARPTTSLRKSS